MSKIRVAIISEARRRMHAAEHALDVAVKKHFPIGAEVEWRIGDCSGALCCGEVTGHGYQDRLKVRNHKTGKERWITSYHLYAGAGS